MIKAVVFDLDGVYFKNGKKNFIKNVSERFNVDKELFADFFLNSDFMMNYKRGKISKDEFWDKMIEKFHIESTTEELLKILKEGYNLYLETIELVRKLKENSIKTIVCSNNFKERVMVLQERFNFLKDFDFVVFSYEYSMLKPALFKKVVEITGFRPEEIVVIDDNEKTIEIAKRDGFKTIYCENPSQLETELRELGVL